MDFEDATEWVMLAAGALRPALEDHARDWRERHGSPAPEGRSITHDLCKGASYGLLLYLRQRFPDDEWRIDGGFGIEGSMPDGNPRPNILDVMDPAQWPGGMQDLDGVWRGHFWVSGRLADGTELVVDLTADQFGHGTLVIEPADDPRYRSNVRTHLPDCGLTQYEMAWGEHLTWRFEDHWDPGTMKP